ncbi:MAG: hypothetical protein RE468_11910 [Acidithiobacillus caldus]|uniref:Uncharacterized protein n=1 Tax=Acidithiobacillus caldus TaxID=33059 RepID=A0A1E7YW49_9PROT|nr:hypothetical protein [Acidithiobacillus caldus]OFC60515.1 hypothetical protein BAE30_07950 [Acidithiobacillus caldus]WMT46583.1 MAG: hypothetical protein RE468_11910 [Acidithiobacillus caldus]
MVAHETYKAPTPAMYVACAPKGWRKIAYGISQVETAKTGDPLQLVDTVTLRVYRPANPGAALAIIHHLESIGHPVAVGAFGFKTTQYKAWHIRSINALNPCFSARFAIHLLKENLVWASGRGFVGPSALRISIAAYTVGKLTYKHGGLQYVNAVMYFAQQYKG